MQLIPSIDLLNGDVVRLRHGDFNDCQRYDAAALKLADQYAGAGAEWLHVVDLAASRDGAAANTAPLFQLLETASQKLQVGGGVRRGKDIGKRLQHGAQRVVVGTICVLQPERFLGWLEEFGSDQLVSALDVAIDENGIPWPKAHGWTEGGTQNLWQLLDHLSQHGLKHLLCTDISKDGVLRGPNLELYRELVQRYPLLHIQASGGVSSLRDLQELKATGVASAISGKALLDGCFTVNDAIQVLSE